MNNSYRCAKKSDFKTLSINDIGIDLPDLKNIFESKAVVIGKWLIKYIEHGLNTGSVEVGNILPPKPDFAYKLGVSLGTMQNAFRYIEDMGYVQSKQCIGTVVCDYKKAVFRKLTSKRDLAVEAIKRYIQTSSFKVGMPLPSSRTVSTIIGYNANTTRLALEAVATQGIIEHKYKNSNEYGWILKSLDFELKNTESEKSETLVDMVVKDLEKYISANLKVGDRIPPHSVISEKLKASIKTVHDALKILIDRGILLAKRGRYGTTVIKIPNDNSLPLKPEMSIFAPAADTAFYYYEKTENMLKKMIANEYNVGDKLPSIMELSKEFDLSPNTIRKAFHNLAEDGYLVFSRGRYGGTFVIDIPQTDAQTFKWLAINPQYVLSEKN